ncbi:MAG: dihydrofolate reductase, partial [Prevotella sp.]|nr:dihydrofolate reductase [Prevotella sp.]
MSTIKNNHQDVRFADIQMLRYNLPGFNLLNTRQKLYIYYLAEATLYGRDITFDQFGKYNLRIRRLLESVYSYLSSSQPDDEQFHALRTYLYRIWFSNGIYHHYGSE